jgi:hypothetical protein
MCMDDWVGSSCMLWLLRSWTTHTKKAKQQRWKSLAQKLSLANQMKGISCSPPNQWSVLHTFPWGMPGTLPLPRVERRTRFHTAGIRTRVPVHAISHGLAIYNHMHNVHFLAQTWLPNGDGSNPPARLQLHWDGVTAPADVVGTVTYTPSRLKICVPSHWKYLSLDGQ